MEQQEGFIPVTGGKVWYRKTGDGPGVPLLVLHGGPGGSSLGFSRLHTLADERPVIYYDQLGCGKSDRPDDPGLWTVDRYVEELEQVRSVLGLHELHLLGHSWGTMLAAVYLLGEPGGVKSVTFSSPALSAPRWEKDQRNYLKAFSSDTQEIIERSEREGTTDSEDYQQAMRDFYQRHLCRLDPLPEDVKKSMELMNHQIYGQMWGASEFTVTGSLKTFDVTDRLHELDLPALFLCGRYDEATPETTQYYASLVDGAQFKVLENSSHMTYAEEPERYTDILREFLKDLG